MPSIESHFSHRAGWLRAAVLGANDGLLSTSSLMVGVAAATPARAAVLTAGIAALAAGAFSMAVGEYSSVSSQLDTERADIAKETKELAEFPEAEFRELVAIWERRGLSRELAKSVAAELTEHDALLAHARDELGLDPDDLARPVQAAAVSASSFTVGALVPILTMALLPSSIRVIITVIVTLLALGSLGAVGARLGGAPIVRATLRVFIGGAVALGITSIVGKITGNAVG